MVLHLRAMESGREFLECVCEGVSGREKGSVRSPADHESKTRRLGSPVGSVLDHAKNAL